MTNIEKESLVKEIAEQLINTQSLEIQYLRGCGNQEYYVYYLHLDEYGNIKDYRNHPFDGSDEMLMCCAGSLEEYEDLHELYEKEDLDDPDFRAVCEDLAEQYMERYC